MRTLNPDAEQIVGAISAAVAYSLITNGAPQLAQILAADQFVMRTLAFCMGIGGATVFWLSFFDARMQRIFSLFALTVAWLYIGGVYLLAGQRTPISITAVVLIVFSILRLVRLWRAVTNLDLILSSQSAKEVVANGLFDAFSPASVFGRQQSQCAGLVWGYYGGNAVVSGVVTAIANGTLSLANNATNYVEFNSSTGAVTSNTSGFTGGRVQLYAVVTASGAVTSWTDYRLGSGSVGAQGSTGATGATGAGNSSVEGG